MRCACCCAFQAAASLLLFPACGSMQEPPLRVTSRYHAAHNKLGLIAELIGLIHPCHRDVLIKYILRCASFAWRWHCFASHCTSTQNARHATAACNTNLALRTGHRGPPEHTYSVRPALPCTYAAVGSRYQEASQRSEAAGAAVCLLTESPVLVPLSGVQQFTHEISHPQV